MTNEPLRLLILGAHPDDAELLCAGTLARAGADGAPVAFIFELIGMETLVPGTRVRVTPFEVTVACPPTTVTSILPVKPAASSGSIS